MKKIVFVCSVNRWRSPMAEYLFRDILEKRGRDLLSRIDVSSAGIVPRKEEEALFAQGLTLPEPLFGYRPLACVMFYLMQRGIDSFKHRSRPLNSRIIEEADLVMGVVRKHKEAVLEAYPHAEQKTFCLEDFSTPFTLPEIANEPPGLMPPDTFCMLECDHWEFTDQVIEMIEARLNEASPRILDFLGVRREAGSDL
ncbi:hypothetical protein [Desulfatiglans anilini]|uniref:arsenate reductase/protein-tyrosine-phosphatase family protein n=1 Tax=Desulfatiglans anilini TaxID=90728 RepID=UPI0003FF2B0C|nr:hypothetical protein [Desulfatiglans anilini]